MLWIVLVLVLVSPLMAPPVAVSAEPAQVSGPAPEHACPVCGMLVAKYPKWTATVRYRDGHTDRFDGAKHLFEYLSDMPKWAPERRKEDIVSTLVTEYSTATRVDARNAWYVIGSNVLGPMGRELVPLASEAAATDFIREHGGSRVRFREVDAALLKRLVAQSPRPVQPAAASGGLVQVPDPAARDTCPVCGMFVGKYPEWVATVLYRDGHADHFDGPKDLLKYLLDVSKWAPQRRKEEIVAIGVTEYYGLKRINARGAWYVIGSDVLGPMGHELVPLASEAEAMDFMRDHSGRRVLRFGEVDAALLRRLDRGRL